ncbi:MAG: RecQ family ATP-dependent DNA helicase [Akkermansia sp.]|nr:RecQ family ATP-dependent DNA helicase [Akkermansia sp.]
MDTTSHLPDIHTALQQYFGFSSLRSGQDAIVEAIMQGHDALAIMPTGGGKSLCYQLPALCRSGLTIVVSPLIALMKDQVDALQERGIPAAAINSMLGAEEYRSVMGALRRGELKLLYVAPERFGQEGFMSTLRSLQVSLFAIDEAHCLSQWGHDFRPDYLRLGRVRAELGNPQTVALTATATAQVREDILQTLQLQSPAVIISGFGRNNLDFRITHCEGRKAKFERIRKVVEQWKTGIIYCSTRKNVITVFEEIARQGVRVVAYHAGMSDSEREFSQNAFISGEADVVVATNAFGMGIDRADVRFVVHFEIPGSVEAYYQEAGRAGRDGEQAACELLFNHADLKTQEFFFEGSNPPLHLVRSLYTLLRTRCNLQTHDVQLTVESMAELLGKDVNPMAVSTALSVLLHAGAISRSDIPGSNTRNTHLTDPTRRFDDWNIDHEKLEEKARRDHLKIESITRYAYSTGCRQQWILDYFGETGTPPCGSCDNCANEPPEDAELIEGTEADIVRKALAGVARASRRNAAGQWEAIYGRGKIMDMLRGAKNANTHRYLTALSTYGILSELTEARMKALFRAMNDAGLLSSTGGNLPLITLSAKGEKVMKQEEALYMVRKSWCAASSPAKLRTRHTAALLQSLGVGKMDKRLYEALADLRRDIAEEYHMPVYRVLSTETLKLLATHKPTTIEAACRLKGIGPWTRERTLPAFVDLICDYEGV